jgi:hypothetical protein
VPIGDRRDAGGWQRGRTTMNADVGAGTGTRNTHAHATRLANTNRTSELPLNEHHWHATRAHSNRTSKQALNEHRAHAIRAHGNVNRSSVNRSSEPAPLHPIALMFVGALRTLSLPLLESAIRKNYPSDADLFFLFSLKDPTQKADMEHAKAAGVLHRLKPVRVRRMDAITCENETARLEIKCCDAAMIARASTLGLLLNRATPFTLANHAHGALSYLHVRQGFREIKAYEIQRGKK